VAITGVAGGPRGSEQAEQFLSNEKKQLTAVTRYGPAHCQPRGSTIDKLLGEQISWLKGLQGAKTLSLELGPN
jgi:hypothetical protein